MISLFSNQAGGVVLTRSRAKKKEQPPPSSTGVVTRASRAVSSRPLTVGVYQRRPLITGSNDAPAKEAVPPPPPPPTVAPERKKRSLAIDLMRLPSALAANGTVKVSDVEAKVHDPFSMENFHPDAIPALVKKTLEDIYYDHAHPAGFSSPQKLYLAAKKKLPHISQRQVRRWMSTQRTYGLTRAVYRNFKRRKIVVRGLAHQYQADLLDMGGRTKREIHDDLGEEAEGVTAPGLKNDNNKRDDDSNEQKGDFLLTVIDCFSRFAQAVPVKSKSGPHVLEGFEKVFNNMGIPKKVQTDDGKEFFNQHVQNFFRRLGIIHFSTDQELKAPIVERFNRTLREKINKYMTANMTQKYHHVLPDIIHAYNSSVHSALETYAPKDVNFNNENLIRQIQYGPFFAEKSKIQPKFQIGDVVRVVRFRKGLKKLKTTFKRELFVITDVVHTSPVTYQVQSKETGVAVWGSYYEHQLQKVNSPT